MFRRTLTVLFASLLLVLFSSSVFSGEIKRVKGKTSDLKYRIATQQDEDNLISRIKWWAVDPTESVGDTAGMTWYDYPANSIIRPMVANSANGAHFTFMRLDGPEPPFQRHQTYNYWSGLFFGDLEPTTNRRTGWGTVLNGPNDEAMIFHHGGGVALQRDAGEGFYTFTETILSGGIFPSAYRDGSTIVVTLDSNSDFVPDTTVYSTDDGMSWSFTEFPETIQDSLVCSSTEAPIVIDPVTGDWVSAYALDAPSGAGWLALSRSSDMGVTWTTQLLIQDGQIIGDATYFVDNFAQVDLNVTDDGVVHIVANGYGGHVDTAAVPPVIDYIIYPVIYWNSRDQQVVELTDPSIGRNPALDGLLDPNFFGGVNARNAIGCAYPHLASYGSDVVVAVWEQNEFDGPPDSTNYIPANDDSLGGAPNPDWGAKDIWGNVSYDGGQTWNGAIYIAGAPGWVDAYTAPDRDIEFDGSHYYLHLAYAYDPVPGMSLFEYLPGFMSWIYARVAVDSLTAIGENPVSVASEFELRQNYPNPFNPSTTIEYSLKRSANVTLEVFNVTGQKVATLVDGRQKAGEHKVVFDASQLASGVYFYKLSSGKVSLTRKMMLLK